MEPKLKLQSEAVTQEMFDRLPALLTTYTVKVVTGWDDHQLAEAERDGTLEAWHRPVRRGRKRSYRLWSKVSVARLVGFRV